MRWCIDNHCCHLILDCDGSPLSYAGPRRTSTGQGLSAVWALPDFNQRGSERCGPRRFNRLEKMSERMSDRMPDRMPDRMSEDIPDRMSEDMPDRMSEDRPDGMPDRYAR